MDESIIKVHHNAHLRNLRILNTLATNIGHKMIINEKVYGKYYCSVNTAKPQFEIFP